MIVPIDPCRIVSRAIVTTCVCDELGCCHGGTVQDASTSSLLNTEPPPDIGIARGMTLGAWKLCIETKCVELVLRVSRPDRLQRHVNIAGDVVEIAAGQFTRMSAP